AEPHDGRAGHCHRWRQGLPLHGFPRAAGQRPGRDSQEPGAVCAHGLRPGARRPYQGHARSQNQRRRCAALRGSRTGPARSRRVCAVTGLRSAGCRSFAAGGWPGAE
ncbi:purL, partial [Symbiodinium sp. CCMP2456]